MKKHTANVLHKKSMWGVLAVSLVAALLLGISCLRYYQRLQQTVTNESSGYLQEISHQIGTNVSRTLDDNFSVLNTLASVLQTANITEFEQTQPIVLTQENDWNYDKILFLDETGAAFDAYGKSVTLPLDENLRATIVGRQRSVSASQTVEGSENIIFSIPVEEMEIGGHSISALAATYRLSTFDRILSMTAFSGEGYCSVNARDGSVIVRPSLDNAEKMGYNTLSTLESSEMDAGSTIEGVRTGMSNGESGMIGFTRNNIHTYMAYSPLENSQWYLLTYVPVEVVNEKSLIMLKLTLLFCGVITLLFAGLFATLTLSAFRHKRKLEQIVYVDTVTGGNTRQGFEERALHLLAHKPPELRYALVYVNVEKFKILNEQFGREACDKMLQAMYAGAHEFLTEQECMCRLSADNFCILAVFTDRQALFNRFEDWYANATRLQETRGAGWFSPMIECGIYLVDDEKVPLSLMIDRAKISIKEAETQETRGKMRCAVYDDTMRRRVFREKQLEDMMEGALAGGEFQVYLQPKYLTESEKIGGAEALVRWKSASEGMIYPDEFIALFEKNGFIIQLDLYVFEQVCKTIRRWIDKHWSPIAVSVNCSRIHLRNPHFLEDYRKICDRYRIPAHLIEIELTESVVFEDVCQLSRTIDEIHQIGFGCSMDDFGSGYSSLNLIRDIPVDTIKLDKVFFSTTANDNERMESVVGSILTMSKALQMKTVAEGVEEQLQVDMLKRLGCDFIQGYYYAKPMPIPDFEKLAFGET